MSEEESNDNDIDIDVGNEQGNLITANDMSDDDDDMNHDTNNDTNNDMNKMDENSDNDENKEKYSSNENNENNENNESKENNENNENNERRSSDEMDQLFGVSDDDNEEGDTNMKNNKNNWSNNDSNIIKSASLSKSPEIVRFVPKGKKEEKIVSHAVEAPMKGSSMYLLKLPKSIGIEPNAYIENEYYNKLKDYSNKSKKDIIWNKDNTGANMTIGDFENIDSWIRWRIITENDEKFMESNTKLVKWNDGSFSFLIGNEVYDITESDMTGNTNYLYSDLTNEMKTNDNDSNEVNSLSASNSQSKGFYECHGPFTSRFNVKNPNKQTFAKIQKSIAARHQRTKGTKQLTVLERKKQRKQEQAKSQAESERLRESKQQKYNRRKSSQKSKMSKGFWQQPTKNSDNSSSDDDDNGNSNSKQRSSRQRAAYGQNIDNRLRKAKNQSDKESESGSKSQDNDDDDDSSGSDSGSDSSSSSQKSSN